MYVLSECKAETWAASFSFTRCVGSMCRTLVVESDMENSTGLGNGVREIVFSVI